MDRIMPIDLERAQLRKSIRGYAVREVEPMLKGAAESLQIALVDNDRLKAELERTRADLENMRAVENTVRDALVLAQKVADETRAAAHAQAEAIIEQGRHAAWAERLKLQQDALELRWEIDNLKILRGRFLDDFRALLDRYRREVAEPCTLSVVHGEAAAVAGA